MKPIGNIYNGKYKLRKTAATWVGLGFFGAVLLAVSRWIR